jgi:hypothetical protein
MQTKIRSPSQPLTTASAPPCSTSIALTSHLYPQSISFLVSRSAHGGHGRHEFCFQLIRLHPHTTASSVLITVSTAARADWCYRARAQRSTHAYQARDLSVIFVFLELHNKGHCTHLIGLEPVFRDHRDHELGRQGDHHHEKLAQVPGTLLLNLENLCRILRYLENLHGLVCRRCSALCRARRASRPLARQRTGRLSDGKDSQLLRAETRTAIGPASRSGAHLPRASSTVSFGGLPSSGGKKDIATSVLSPRQKIRIVFWEFKFNNT